MRDVRWRRTGLLLAMLSLEVWLSGLAVAPLLHDLVARVGPLHFLFGWSALYILTTVLSLIALSASKPYRNWSEVAQELLGRHGERLS